MAVTETTSSQSVNIVLTVDTNKTENVSIGPVNETATIDNTKVWNIAEAFGVIAEYPVAHASKTIKSIIKNNS